MPALIYHTQFSSAPGAAPRGGGMGAEQLDRRIIREALFMSTPFTKFIECSLEYQIQGVLINRELMGGGVFLNFLQEKYMCVTQKLS